MKVKLDDLIDAFEVHFEGQEHYLDKQTGRLILLTDDARYALEKIDEDRFDSNGREIMTFEVALKKRDEPEWMINFIEDAKAINEDDTGRYIPVPTCDSHDGWRDMADFIGTVEDQHLSDLLGVAISGSGAFRRFKDVLARHPDERQRWFAFQRERNRKRVRDWLEGLGVEVRL